MKFRQPRFVFGVGVVIALAAGQATAQTLDPTLIHKYAEDLVIPPAMPKTEHAQSKKFDYYEIAVRQFRQQILPAGMPQTTVWGYGSVNHAGTFNAPSFTIEATVGRPVRVKWINGLVDEAGKFLPHLLPVDQTLHWANPVGPIDHHSMDPTPYIGPVPIVTHVHGAETTEESDGYTEAWYLPAAVNVGDFFPVGTWYDRFRDAFAQRTGVTWDPGTATFEYPNDQRAATLWYHDHALGMTRLNVYAGPAGFFILRGGPSDHVTSTGPKHAAAPRSSSGVLPGPAPQLGDLPGTRYYEIPVAIQDRSFNEDGSLFYPSSREYFDGFAGPYIPDSDISPIWNPEFFGNTMMVNGRTWPVLNVEPRRYRFRLLNGCNSRFLILKLVAGDPEARPAASDRPFWQIGAEGGFLTAPVALSTLLMAPAERADVVVDFSGLAPGSELYLINEGPDEPFGGGIPGTDFPCADPQTSGQVMKFKVGTLQGVDTSAPPARLKLPSVPNLGKTDAVRMVALLEEDSAVLPDVGPRAALLGTVDLMGVPMAMMWGDPVTEVIRQSDTEIWEIHNFTMDAHPIHVHQVQFQVVDRRPMSGMGAPNGEVRPPEVWETGLKDTVIAYPGEITRIRARFDLPGRYVWHCHIVEHEDNEMMRPFDVVR
ncbi:MAG: multicopper oxidase [Phycisphaerae bacterium]